MTIFASGAAAVPPALSLPVTPAFSSTTAIAMGCVASSANPVNHAWGALTYLPLASTGPLSAVPVCRRP